MRPASVSLIDALMGKDYRTPFADEAMDWVMANLMGIIFLWIPAWMIVPAAGLQLGGFASRVCRGP